MLNALQLNKSIYYYCMINFQVFVERVDSKEGTTDGDTNNTFGFSLKYMGSGTGMANRLAIWPDNLNNTKYEAFSIFNTGKVALYDDNQGGYGFYGDPTHHFNVYGDCLIRGNIDIQPLFENRSLHGVEKLIFSVEKHIDLF